jgi:transcriptional antiterminator RfaH
MTEATTKQWFVLTSKPREEQRAADNLTAQGYSVFLPKVARIKKRQGIKSVALEPLFPSYLFIQLDTNEVNFNAIRSTRGVGSFVRFGLQPATIDKGIIDAIKQSIADDQPHKTLDELVNYHPGDAMEFTQGPFKGLQAIYQAKDGLARSILMVKMLGQESQMSVNNLNFEKRAQQRK